MATSNTQAIKDRPKPNNISQARARTKVVGKASKYNEKYLADTLSYPIDLFTDRDIYGGNYVVFYINVPSNSALIKNSPEFTTSLDTAQLRGGIASAEYEVGTIAAVNAVKLGAATGIISALKTGSFKGVAGPALKASVVGVALAAVTVAATNVDIVEGITNVLSTKRQNRRLITSIALNVPQALSARYSADYGSEDMDTSAGIADITGDIARAISAGSKSLSAGKEAAGVAATNAINVGVAQALKIPGIGGFNSAATGLAANPKKEQVFTGVDFRIFNFEYNFAPRNPEEADHVREIINMFKLHMHPEFKDERGFLFIYPSEFDIFYYKDGQENLNLPRHTSCVLTDLTVNYAPNGSFNTFADGMPSQITVSLTFKELAILTKAEIQDGY